MATVPGSPFTNPLIQLLGYALGVGVGPILRPGVQDILNEAWSLHPVRRPDAGTLASGVAQGQVNRTLAEVWARETGFGQDQFNALVDIANVGPGAAYAFEMWRRNVIGEQGFRRAVLRLGLEQEWIDDLVALKQVLLSPAELAVMVQRTVVPDPGLLPNQPDTAGSNVPPMPVVDIDVLAEAAAAGINPERMAALTRIIGLPASPDLAARMHFRKIITEGAFNQAILEGNTRGEWAPFLLEGFRDIPTTRDFIEGRLRGWIGDAAMYDGAALHGMVKDDVDLLFKVTGRPLSFHQVFIGERRGGTYDGGTAGIDPAFLKSLQESNIRPEWYDLAWAQRHTYPSAFVLRALVQSGDLTADEGYDILLRIGWPEGLARTVADRWGGGAGAASDPHVAKAETQLWATTHRSYIASEATTADVQARFSLLKIPSAAQGTILELWGSERELIRKQLTPAQVKKAWAKRTRNYATGAAWTRDDAIAALVSRGYSVTEANDFLDL